MAGILKMIVVLTALCGLSGFVLSYLKTVTAPAIEEQVLRNVQGPALASVFAKGENNPIADRHVFKLEDAFPSKQGGKLVGVALEEHGAGYGGPIGVIVGFNTANDTLAGIGTTQLSETPGLGMRVKEPSFREQFAGAKLPVKLSAQGGSIDGISGATISSKGVIEAVEKAEALYKKLKPELVQFWGGK